MGLNIILEPEILYVLQHFFASNWIDESLPSPHITNYWARASYSAKRSRLGSMRNPYAMYAVLRLYGEVIPEKL